VTFALALVGLALGAWNLLRVLLVSHALIWRIPITRPRNMTLSALSIVGVVLLSNLLMGLLARTRTGLTEWIAGIVLLTVVAAGLWMAGSLRVFPHPEDVTWRGVLPGALLFAFGVELLHVVTVVWFAPYLQSKSETYGAIGAAVAILLWAYLLGRVITAAAALNAVMWEKPSPAAQPAPEP
jgi:membrane protein